MKSDDFPDFAGNMCRMFIDEILDFPCEFPAGYRTILPRIDSSVVVPNVESWRSRAL